MTKEEVAQAVATLRQRGQRVSQNAIIKEIGGSKRDVPPLLKAVLEEDENSPGTASTPSRGPDQAGMVAGAAPVAIVQPGGGPGLWVRITRPLPAVQRTYEIGELVEVSSWDQRRLRQLIDQHWVSLYEPPPPPPPVEERTARLMSTQASLAQLQTEQETHQTTLERLQKEYTEEDVKQQVRYDEYLDTNARMAAMEALVALDEHVGMAQHRNEVVRETRRLARVVYLRGQERLMAVGRTITQTNEALEELARQIRAEERLCWLLEHAPEIQERLDHLGRELLRATDEYTRHQLREASKNAEAQAQALYAARNQAAAD